MREARSQNQMDRASQAYNAALANVGAGIGSMASGLAEAAASAKDKEDKEGNGGIIERLRARYGNLDGSQKQRTAQDQLDLTSKIKMPTAESDFAQNYMSRFERPSIPSVKDANPLKQAQEKPSGFGSYDFSAEVRKSMGFPAIGAYDEMLGRSTNPDALNAPFVPTIDQYGYQATPENEAIISKFRDKMSLERSTRASDFKKSKDITFTPKENEIISAWEKSQKKRDGWPIREQGGMMTKGAFNHNTNPIHLVQNGEKVGEATGGEMILNPEQAKAIAQESSYARKLFKKFAKNAKNGK